MTDFGYWALGGRFYIRKTNICALVTNKSRRKFEEELVKDGVGYI